MGVYVLSKSSLSKLPEEGFYNLPDFIMNLNKSEKFVQAYKHEGYWLDIGRAEDYEKACKDISDN